MDPQKYSSEELVKFIENDALTDIKDINIPADDEPVVDIKLVNTWYIETEKLIRILANTIPSTMAQPINQLRYAGHHILKSACIISNGHKNNSDLVEAYKHCKRAYYDALDLYVYDMSDIFRSKVNLLPNRDEKLLNKIIKHLDLFTELRLNTEHRIEYYSNISKTLKEGLVLINIINSELNKQKITANLLQEKSLLIKEINDRAEQLESCEQTTQELRYKLDTEISASESRFNKKFTTLSIIVILITGLSILFQGFFTEVLTTKPTSKHLINIKTIPTIVHDNNIKGIPNFLNIKVTTVEEKNTTQLVGKSSSNKPLSIPQRSSEKTNSHHEINVEEKK